jgi:hypothetical protein
MNITDLYSKIKNLDNQHILYLVKLKNNEEEFCKIGITSTTIDERMSYEINYTYELILSIKGDGYYIRGLESVLKEQVLDFNQHYKPKKHINGYSECYNVNYQLDIETAIRYLIKKNKRKVKKEDDKLNVNDDKLDRLEKVIDVLNKQLQYEQLAKEFYKYKFEQLNKKRR